MVRRPVTVAVLVLLALPVFAGPNVPGASPLVFGTALELQSGFLGNYVTMRPELVYRPGRAGIGAGVALVVAAWEPEVLLVPAIRTEFGPLFLEAGWVVELYDPPRADETRGAQVIDDGPVVRLGASWGGRLGPGSLGLSVGLAHYLPRSDPDQPELPVRALIESWRWAASPPAWLVRGLEATVGTTLLTVGVAYRVRL